MDTVATAKTAEPIADTNWTWAFALASVAVLLTACQITLPLPGPKISLADPAMGLAFLALLYYQLKTGRDSRFPWGLGLFLVLYHFAAILSRSGKSGTMECVQRTEQLFCGLLVVAWLLNARRRWVLGAITAGVGVNVLVALSQAASHGYGDGVTGLFGSTAALSFFLAVSLCWCLPVWLGEELDFRLKTAGVVGAAIAMTMIVHGQLLALTVVVLIAQAMFHRAGPKIGTWATLFLTLLMLLGGPGASSRRSVLSASLSPFRGSRAKQAHTEVIAATRMGVENFWSGVGPGHYQTNIGTYYRELFNPNENQIKTDTQSGLGILLGTAGVPVALLLMLVLCSTAVSGLKRYLRDEETHGSYAMAGAGAAMALAGGMFVSDPLIRGLGWTIPLAIASIGIGNGAASPAPLWMRMGWQKTVACGAALGFLSALVLVAPPASQAGPRPSVPRTPTPPTPPEPTELKAPPAVETAGANLKPAAFEDDWNFIRVLQATDATVVAAPMKKEVDGTTGRTVLHLPDETCKPPDGAEPDMVKYGGAQFELDVPKNLKTKVWLRTWWAGSCGNTVYFKLDSGDVITVGNDGTYKEYHWLLVPADQLLAKGKHTIQLLNREDGIKVDQIFISGDAEYVPQGVEME